jgi:hypothetical protein
MTAKKTPKKTGPAPARLVIDANWKDAVKHAMTKPKPKPATPAKKSKRPRSK